MKMKINSRESVAVRRYPRHVIVVINIIALVQLLAHNIHGRGS